MTGSRSTGISRAGYDAIFLSHAFISNNDYFTDKLCQLYTHQQMPNARFSVALPIQPIPSPLARRFVEILQEETNLMIAHSNYSN